MENHNHPRFKNVNLFEDPKDNFHEAYARVEINKRHFYDEDENGYYASTNHNKALELYQKNLFNLQNKILHGLSR